MACAHDAGMESIRSAIAGMPLLADVHDNSIQPLEGGLTNNNYRVTAGGSCYVVRIGGRGTAALGIDRIAEQAAHLRAAAAGIAPELIHFSRHDDVLVTRFIDGHTPTIEEMQSPEGIARIAGMMLRIHALPPNGARYCPFAKARAWAGAARQRHAEFPADFADLSDRMREVEAQRPFGPALALCHNDLVRGNLIDAGGRLRVIDWEYSGVNAAMFDLAVVCMNSRYSHEHEERLLAAYFGGIEAGQHAELRRYKLAFDYHMGIWYLLQSRVSTLKVPFPQGAAHHFNRLRHNLKNV
jgi:thiamine kinase-like enzyme